MTPIGHMMMGQVQHLTAYLVTLKVGGLSISCNLSNLFPGQVTLGRMEPLRFCQAWPAPLGLPGYANLQV